MKANELMIGDWVECVDSTNKKKVYAQIDAIEEGQTCILVRLDNCNWFLDIYFIKPIPLTTEILEKNGFTKSTPPPGIHARCYELDNNKDRYHLTIADYNKYKRLLLNIDSEDSECFNIKCDYVHEFQHALRLCCIEKEIEL